jgi:hypothetical protein
LYFALKDRSEIGKALEEKRTNFEFFLRDSGRQNLYNNLYREFYQAKYHHGNMYATGENGEFLNININEFRTGLQHIKSLILSQKITLSPAATNTDTDAMSQTLLGKNIMSYYAKQLKFDLLMDTSIDLANLYADMYALTEWDVTKGAVYIQDDLGQKVYEGDPVITLHPPHMVAIDPLDPDSMWHIFMVKGNKYELAALHPEFAQEIEKEQMQPKYVFDAQINLAKYTGDTIYYFKFFHRDCPLVPGGRQVTYINDHIVLEDKTLEDMPYPVTKFQVSNVEDSPLGYTSAFDAIQISQANNKIYSTMVTNESKFGIKTVLFPKGCDIEPIDVAGGAVGVEYDPTAGAPSTLDLLATSEQTFGLGSLLTSKLDITFGINDVTKGQAPKDIKSGSGLALLQSMSVQFNSTLQKNFVVFLEELATKLFRLLQQKVRNPRLVEIVGQDQEMYTKEWSGDSLKGIQKVVVELGDPAKDTAVGRQQVADNLLQYGEISMDEYFQVRETGNAGIKINDAVSHAMLISREDEMLMKGIKPIISKADKHADHFKKHNCLLDHPDIRNNPEKAAIILEHNQEHEDMLKMLTATDPAFLEMSGQAPLQSMMMQMMPPPGGPEGAPPPPGAQQDLGAPEGNMPGMPNNPATGNDFNLQDAGLGEPNGPQ